MGSPLYVDLSGSSEIQAVLSISLHGFISSGHSSLHGFIRQFWAFLFTYFPLYMDLGIPLYIRAFLFTWIYQAVLGIPLYMDLSGSSGHSSLHGFIRQFWAFLFTWIYQAVLGSPLYMDLSGSSGHSSLRGFIRKFWAVLFTWIYQAILAIPEQF